VKATKEAIPMTRTIAASFRRGVLAAALFAAIPGLAAQEAIDASGVFPLPLPALLLHDQVHAQLRLDADQEALWKVLDGLDVELQARSRSSRGALQRVALSELAKAAPNLVLVEAARAHGQQGVDSAIQAVNNYAASLYASLSAEQRSLVASAARAYYQQAAEAARAR
jgi:hypothetical protein